MIVNLDTQTSAVRVPVIWTIWLLGLRTMEQKSVDFANAFQRFGSSAMVGLSEEERSRILVSFLDGGFTGETYADFDKPLRMNPTDDIVIIHFNDVYNIEPDTDGSGGISRFVNALRQYASSNPLILFSGDAFNPSILSTQTRGRHMIPFLNILKIHTACLGNHDFDFGIDHLEYLRGSTQFPWLMSNVLDSFAPTTPLAQADMYRIFEWQGHRIGIMGLVEEEWLQTLPTVQPEDVIYVDFVKKANELSKMFRSKECDLIIALTHMRAPNDERLAREAEDVDLILGGHDHEYYGARRIANSIVVKSGTDFREFTKIVINPGKRTGPGMEASDTGCGDESEKSEGPILVPDNEQRGKGVYMMPRFCGGSRLSWKRVDVNPNEFNSNRHVDSIVSRYVETLSKQMDKVIGETAVELESRFSVIRTSESNLGNWLTDLMRITNKTDVAVLNSGTIRSDKLMPIGPVKMADLFSMLPMRDTLVVLSITGTQLYEVLENSVSQYPKTEGRFLQVSGLKFTFNPEAAAGSRIIRPANIARNDGKVEEIQLDKKYTLCTKEYIAIQGKDGFDVLTDCPVLRDSETCQDLSTVARNAFTMAAMANGFRKPHSPQSERHLENFKAAGAAKMKIKRMPTAVQLGTDGEEQRYQLYCCVEGRITQQFE